MSATRQHPRRRLGAAAIALTAAVALAGALAAASTVAGAADDPLAGVGSVRKATVTVTVVSVDAATRRVVVDAGGGQHFTLKAPPEMRNFDQLQAGQKITATYAVETAFALSPPNGPLPPDTETTLAARAAKGELPAAVVANHIVVTGAIVGIDLATSTLKVVSPQGGEVYSIAVRTAAGRAALPKLKVGDKVTAYITEGMLLAAKPG